MGGSGLPSLGGGHLSGTPVRSGGCHRPRADDCCAGQTTGFRLAVAECSAAAGRKAGGPKAGSGVVAAVAATAAAGSSCCTGPSVPSSDSATAKWIGTGCYTGRGRNVGSPGGSADTGPRVVASIDPVA